MARYRKDIPHGFNLALLLVVSVWKILIRCKIVYTSAGKVRKGTGLLQKKIVYVVGPKFVYARHFTRVVYMQLYCAIRKIDLEPRESPRINFINRPSPYGDHRFIKLTWLLFDGQLAKHTNKVL